MKTALVQLLVKEDKKDNLDRAETHIVKAARDGAKLIVLPEMFCCPYALNSFEPFSEKVPSGESCRRLSRLAKSLRVTLVGGSLPERDGKKLYNTSPVFGPDGKLIAKHRKIHLFDVTLKGVDMKESAVLSSGNKITVFKTPLGPMGLVICYDARFPELFRMMLKKKIVGVVMPGAFSAITGAAHWHALLKIRAVDNQVFMIAASPARNLKASYHAFGHSLIADPWGSFLTEAETAETVVSATLDIKKLKDVRERLPLLAHRKPALYRNA